MASKTVLITGASRGIGFALADHYVRQGWKVIACARTPSTADKVRHAFERVRGLWVH
jgi:NAD(P)-dependent dehydrogenase (short-subunit alcohol dehydrogenase family)